MGSAATGCRPHYSEHQRQTFSLSRRVAARTRHCEHEVGPDVVRDLEGSTDRELESRDGGDYSRETETVTKDVDP